MTRPTDAAPANRLAASTSPYLRQHAHNPVDWYEWGEEALARARALDRPILLSIGYSACHWCHVMAHESFEDPAIAALMNAHFVNVKVDREERPDLDDIYMAATVAMNHGQGGWPMTVFLTPDQQPFLAGTYFPPEDRWGRPGFPTILTRVAELWRTNRARLVAQGAQLVEYLRRLSEPAPGAAPGPDAIQAAVAELATLFDARWGGFGRAPKFPPTGALQLLLRHWRRTGDAPALAMVRTTLDRMARGGMYDQVGGGFCRYSTDERWLVPHFEKMLYDNALLARAYLEGWQATGEPEFARVAREVLDYVLREMTAPEGGFWSATDADSEGVEGKFFVWTLDEARHVIGGVDADFACDALDITAGGNWEGHSIPNLPRPLDEVARAYGIPPGIAREKLARARAALYEARARRVPPALDDKVLTAWNGLMIGAMAEGARVLGDARWLAAARRAAEFVLATLRRADGRLLRSYRAGTAHLPACLEDYAYLADGLLDLHEAGGGDRWLHEALALAEVARHDFAAPEGGFFSTAVDHETLIVRHREGHDGATPSANATMARVLARLGAHLARPALRDEAVRALSAWGAALARQPRAFLSSLCLADWLRDGPVELAFVGGEDDAGLAALRDEVARHFLPNRIVAWHDPARGPGDHPLTAGKTTVAGRAALYVCRDFACQRPVTEPAGVAGALAAR